MGNPWVLLRGAMPAAPITEGTVTAIGVDGLVTVETFRGGVMRCRSDVAVQVDDEVEVEGQVIRRVIGDVTTVYETI